jgi:superoxide dismutase, Fe-Mn family
MRTSVSQLNESKMKLTKFGRPRYRSDFRLAPLPYRFDALDPYLPENTMRIHYEGHYRGYVELLNVLKHGTPYDKLSLEEIMFNYSYRDKGKLDKKIFEMASQVWNHEFYWKCLSPRHNQKPSDNFSLAIAGSYVGFNDFVKKFTEVALEQFGSGWVWLVKKADQSLDILSTSNADNPRTKGLTPLLVCDVWEHAYYLEFHNDRKSYIENFWPLVNWGFVDSQLMAEIDKMELPRGI